MANLPDSFSDTQSGVILKHQLVNKITPKTVEGGLAGQIGFHPESLFVRDSYYSVRNLFMACWKRIPD
jgi:hypothetical protein